MRYLVTGGVGFLGTNLCLNLLEEGNEVVVLDDLSTGFEKNLETLSGKENFRFIKHDIVEPLPQLDRFDFIYNLACPASPPRYQKDPLQTLRTSVFGIWNVLHFAKKDKTPVFQASTSEIYGDPLVHPQTESYWGNVNPIGARACYDEGKRAAECLLMDFNKRNKHPVKIARIFNTYGPFMDPKDGRVISNFIMQTLKDEPLTIYGDGSQTRSFCYVDDLIAAFRKFEATPMDFTGPMNIGNPKEFSLIDLVSLIEKIAGKSIEKKFVDLPENDPRKRNPDISMAKEIIGWEPKTSLEQGLRKSIDYFRQFADA